MTDHEQNRVKMTSGMILFGIRTRNYKSIDLCAELIAIQHIHD